MKLLLAGGGTGGHVFPALAVAQEWLRRGAGREVLLVGTERGLESRLVPEAGLPLATIRVAGLKGIRGLRLLRNALQLPLACVDSARLVRRFRPEAAFGVGGYASGPVLLMAVLWGIPAVIFEPNAEAGFANRRLAPMARRIATAHEVTARRWGGRARVTGCPVRAEFFAVPPKPHRPPFTVLITGGSQGAHAINEAMVGALPALAARRDALFLVHQTGERDYNAVRAAYAQHSIPAEVVPFIQAMADTFARADLIVCRSGAITVAEVAAAGRAAIFIPFGAATDSHQLRNAEAMVGAGAARLIPQSELSAQRLAREICAVLDAPEELARMETAARRQARPDAVAQIVDLIEEAIRT